MMQKEKARAILQQMLGPAADFREGQWEAIDLAANQRQRVLVVQRTGWGKSVVYFVATLSGDLLTAALNPRVRLGDRQ